MNVINDTTGKGLSRRSFLKAAGVTTAMFVLPDMLAGAGFAENPGRNIDGSRRTINHHNRCISHRWRHGWGICGGHSQRTGP